MAKLKLYFYGKSGGFEKIKSNKHPEIINFITENIKDINEGFIDFTVSNKSYDEFIQETKIPEKYRESGFSIYIDSNKPFCNITTKSLLKVVELKKEYNSKKLEYINPHNESINEIEDKIKTKELSYEEGLKQFKKLTLSLKESLETIENEYNESLKLI